MGAPKRVLLILGKSQILRALQPWTPSTHSTLVHCAPKVGGTFKGFVGVIQGLGFRASPKLGLIRVYIGFAYCWRPPRLNLISEAEEILSYMCQKIAHKESLKSPSLHIPQESLYLSFFFLMRIPSTLLNWSVQ